jgi:F-type H+-transporting ATPase subunit delta
MSLAIATRYATALADVLSSDKADTTPQAALAQLRDFQGMIDAAPELRTLLLAPSVDVESKKRLAATIGDRIGFSKSVRNLTFVLLDNRRITLLPELISAFEQWFDEKQGISRISVTSAAPLLDDQRAAVIDKFQRLTGREIHASFHLDETLLGGVVVRVGSKLYDGSLSSQLQVLDRAMSGRL